MGAPGAPQAPQRSSRRRTPEALLGHARRIRGPGACRSGRFTSERAAVAAAAAGRVPARSSRFAPARSHGPGMERTRPMRATSPCSGPSPHVEQVCLARAERIHGGRCRGGRRGAGGAKWSRRSGHGAGSSRHARPCAMIPPRNSARFASVQPGACHIADTATSRSIGSRNRVAADALTGPPGQRTIASGARAPAPDEETWTRR